MYKNFYGIQKLCFFVYWIRLYLIAVRQKKLVNTKYESLPS